MNITDCKRFAYCNASICPLDPNMLNRVHLDGEPTCYLLREYSKPHARENLKGVIPRKLFKAVETAHPIVFSRYAPLKKALNRAAKTPSRLNKPIIKHRG